MEILMGTYVTLSIPTYLGIITYTTGSSLWA